MIFLYDLLSYLGYFAVMIIFMVVAIVAAKSAFGLVCYLVGAVLQLIPMLGNAMSGSTMISHWLVYLGLLLSTAVIVTARRDSKKSKEEKVESQEPSYICDMCKHSFNKVTYVKTSDDVDVDGKNLCDDCMLIYQEERDQKTETKVEERAENKIQFCRKCGSKLPDDAIFCNKCGTKISEIEKGGE